ncbi:glucose-6-phosphate 1-epimerase [Methylophilaceae bacterium]|nr:glucose-6-phosphate 1-epimerase [Methylophilaceae bacterium]
MPSLQLVEKDLQLDSHVTFCQDANGLKFLEIENDHATAKVALQGGHVMTWQPRHAHDPVLWLSDHARYVHGRSIRGGVPICWPWFGAHPTDSTLCPHGFARVMPWDLMDSCTLPDGSTRLVMQIMNTPVAQKQLSYPYTLTLTVDIGDTLKLALATTNRGSHPFMIGEAFHTYFQVSDVENISLGGLDGAEYADKVLNYERATQEGEIRFDGEFDRVYMHTNANCVIRDPGLNRFIRISKSGSNATVIWTPWQEKAHELGDMGTDDSWRRMICVESANALENMVMITPNQTHTMSVKYSTQML